MNADVNAGAGAGLHKDITEAIIGAAFDVANTLGCGYLEKVYENALCVGLKEKGLSVSQQVPVRVSYHGQTVGDYISDMIVESAVLVEVKATLEYQAIYAAQVLNYLKATNLPVGLLLNFGRPKLTVKRFVLGRTLRDEPGGPALEP